MTNGKDVVRISSKFFGCLCVFVFNFGLCSVEPMTCRMHNEHTMKDLTTPWTTKQQQLIIRELKKKRRKVTAARTCLSVVSHRVCYHPLPARKRTHIQTFEHFSFDQTFFFSLFLSLSLCDRWFWAQRAQIFSSTVSSKIITKLSALNAKFIEVRYLRCACDSGFGTYSVRV